MTLTTNGPTKVRYDPTETDRLWLLRAVEAEGEPRDMVASTLVSGFLAARTRGYKSSLATFVQAYSQPVNPRWLPDGDLHAKWRERDPEERAARRLQHRARGVFRDETTRAVDKALTEGPSLVATDFAAPSIKPKAGLIPIETGKPGNRFYTRAGWQGYSVVTGSFVVALLLVSIIGAAAWMAHRA
jgi:hypothetical protein